MIVLSDTSVEIPYFCVVRQENFIIIGGPIAKALSICSCSANFSIPIVTTPFSPFEPSSVMMISSSDDARSSSSRITSSAVRPANTVSTRLPAAFSPRTIGNIGAAPTPPQAHITVPNFSMCVGLPSGPTTSATSSPTSLLQSLVDDSPTSCITSVMVPRSTSLSAMVSGIRSLCLSTRTITKLPGLRLLAISGASISKRNTFSENCFLVTILYIMFLLFV